MSDHDKPAPVNTPQTSKFAPGDPVPNLDMWLLERWLGGGGFGEVWLATKRTGIESRAVKFCTHPVARNRLASHEMNVVLHVQKHMKDHRDHPNIVALLECNLTGDSPWLMYEFVEGGRTLGHVIDECRSLPAQERIAQTIRTLRAVAAAVGLFHRLQIPIVHRDLKPQNILMAGEVPRITDFGIGGAAVTAAISDSTGGLTEFALQLPTMLQTTGTLRYASPEQLRGEIPHPRDDVYALGVIAYQMLVGRVDAEVKGNWQKRLKVDGVPEPLLELIGNSTSDERDDRPKDAAEWETLLAACLPESSAADPGATAARPGTLGGHSHFKEEPHPVAGMGTTPSPHEREMWEQEAAEFQRAQREIELARKVQLGFLPQTLPDVPGYSFYSHYSPAKAVGGDYYDFVPLYGGRTAVVIGEVSGKGVPAALFVAKLISEVRFCLLTVPDLSRAVSLLNDHMTRSGLEDRFVTLTVMVLDPVAHSLAIVNAGHMTPLVYRKAADEFAEAMTLETTGMPIGVLTDYTYEQFNLALHPGDAVVAFTDGIPDAINPAGTPFGAKGALRSLAAYSVTVPTGAQQAKYFGDYLVAAVRDHARNGPQQDDICVVCFGRIDATRDARS